MSGDFDRGLSGDFGSDFGGGFGRRRQGRRLGRVLSDQGQDCGAGEVGWIESEEECFSSLVE